MHGTLRLVVELDGEWVMCAVVARQSTDVTVAVERPMWPDPDEG